ncbi:MAG: hypothetical protein KF895_16120, partial [Parvibaculum sp.]|nr:hypothetical protein [Parvibaculum sp.]
MTLTEDTQGDVLVAVLNREGQIVKNIDAKGEALTVTFDARDRSTSVVDRRGQSTS